MVSGLVEEILPSVSISVCGLQEHRPLPMQVSPVVIQGMPGRPSVDYRRFPIRRLRRAEWMVSGWMEETLLRGSIIVGIFQRDRPLPMRVSPVVIQAMPDQYSVVYGQYPIGISRRMPWMVSGWMEETLLRGSIIVGIFQRDRPLPMRVSPVVIQAMPDQYSVVYGQYPIGISYRMP